MQIEINFDDLTIAFMFLYIQCTNVQKFHKELFAKYFVKYLFEAFHLS